MQTRAATLIFALLLGCGLQSGSGGGCFNQGYASRTVHAGTYSKAEEYMVYAREGSTIVIVYDITVNQGSVILQVRPYAAFAIPEPIERQTIRSTSRGEVRVPVPESGRYEVRVSPWGLNGSYDITWHVE